MSAMPTPPAKTPAEATQATAVSQITPWLERFHSQYPMGGLVTTLATIHEGQYIVQATLSVGGLTLTSGLAEAATLAEAEAIAQGIALDRFGLEKLAPMAASVVAPGVIATPAISPATTSAGSTASTLPATHPTTLPTTAAMEAAPAIAATNGAPPAAPTAPAPPVELSVPETATASIGAPMLSEVPASGTEPVVVEEPLAIAAPEPVQPAPEKPAPEKSAPEKSAPEKVTKGKKAKAKPKPKSKAKSKPSTDPSPDPSPETIASITDAMPQEEAPKFVADWSDDLAQIQVELKRLGWDANQSSDYLQRTYGKPSLDYITDHGELMDFLSYLRALPTHFDPGQFDEPASAAATFAQPKEQLENQLENQPELDHSTLEQSVSHEPDAEINIPAGYEQPAPMAAPPVVDVAPGVGAMDNNLTIAATLPEPDIQTPDIQSEIQPEIQTPEIQTPEIQTPEIQTPDIQQIQPESDEEMAPHDFGGLSRDDMMQQSAAECKRLKWTNRQGSNFLKSRYNKPTRKELSDQELWDFLQYLSSIAPVEETVKEKLPF